MLVRVTNAGSSEIPVRLMCGRKFGCAERGITHINEGALCDRCVLGVRGSEGGVPKFSLSAQSVGCQSRQRRNLIG